MSTMSDPAPAATVTGWFSRSEAWLDSKGKWAWIGAMVLGFVFFWPVGLALLFYMIWSKRMFNSSCRNSRAKMKVNLRAAATNTGNSAFDAYKSDTLARLEREQNEFEAFLTRLRESKDKVEFDAFMNERAKAASAPEDGDEAA
jgi:Protein of unknown function (DUF2852)